MELQLENQPPPVQTVMIQSDQSGAPQNSIQIPLAQSESPAEPPPDNQPPPVQTVLIQSAPINQVVYQVQTCRVPAPVPPPAGLQPDNQASPVQAVINPSNAVPYIVQLYGVYPVQNYLPNPIPHPDAPPSAGHQMQNQLSPVQTVVNQSGPSNPASHQVKTYAGYPVQSYIPNPMAHPEGPALAPPPAGLHTQNQPPPVQTAMTQSGPSNPALHQIKPYEGYQVQNYPPNPMPQQGQYIASSDCPLDCAHGTASSSAASSNQPPPVHLDSNQSGARNSSPQQVQPFASSPGDNDLPNPMPQAEGPAPAGLQTQHQLPQIQTVVSQPDPSNPALHQVQAYAGCQPQNQLPNPLPQSEGPAPAPPPSGLQTQNQPAPVQNIVNQSDPSNPAQVQPYAAPPAPPLIVPYGVPPGLEYLTQIDQILIHQKIECIEMLTGFETNNQYEIKNSIGQEIYHAKEKSDCFIRNLCGSSRNFEMRIKDNMGQEVIRLQRPMRCFLQEIEIQAPPGVIIGYVKQEWSCFLPRFSICGPNNEVLLKIHGPFLPFKCCGDINFEVKGLIGGVSVGQIIKQRSGFIKKCFTDASNFCIQFPLDMDVKTKAVLLGACLLIDIMFFDKGGNLFLKILK